MDRIERIREMEARMDQLRAAVEAVKAAEESAEILADYYTGGRWLQDYEADEAGAFPPALKRGVLSQDGLHDLLCEWKRIRNIK